MVGTANLYRADHGEQSGNAKAASRSKRPERQCYWRRGSCHVGSRRRNLVRLSSWRHNNATLFIERLTGPWHYARGGFVGFRRPGIVTEFSGSRNQMKNPSTHPGSDIERPHGPGTANPADNQKILVDNPWRVQTDVRRVFPIE